MIPGVVSLSIVRSIVPIQRVVWSPQSCTALDAPLPRNLGVSLAIVGVPVLVRRRSNDRCLATAAVSARLRSSLLTCMPIISEEMPTPTFDAALCPSNGDARIVVVVCISSRE